MALCSLTLNAAGQDWPKLVDASDSEPLPNTKALTMEGDLSRQLVDANDRFLDQQIELATKNRGKPAGRDRLAELIGLHRDERPENNRFEYFSVQKAQKATAEGLQVYQVRWKAFGDVHGVGLLLEPEGKDHPTLADVIAIPDASQTPEEISGLSELKATSPFALELALSGCRVLVPSLINREENAYKMTHREWVHRPAFMMGRTLVGYELQQILAAVDCLKNTQPGKKDRPVGVIGFGDGGLLSMYSAALDPRIDACVSAGYFGNRNTLWKEPVERNIFGLLTEFGDAEIASLITPQPFLAIGGCEPGYSFFGKDGEPIILDVRPPQKGKPAVINPTSKQAFDTEFKRLTQLNGNKGNAIAGFRGNPFQKGDLETLLSFLSIPKEKLRSATDFEFRKIYADPTNYDSVAERQKNQIAEIERHNQHLLVDAARVRDEYFKELNTDSMQAYEITIEPYREKFRNEVIGRFDLDLLPPNARTRKYQEGPKTISYEVVLDVFDGIFAYGILTLPKDFDLTIGEKRPVIVCQHGLEGSPQDVIGEAKYKAYKAYATRLAEEGFITFAPQNGYKYFDVFRMQQFKSQSIGKTLFSIIVPQHQQITDWLAAQPFVDGEKIGFYGLSYGGKSAMRIPPLVSNYALSICSADFNEWVWKNAATDPKSLRYSYANKGEYEIFEWNLGGTFNYAEMARLIAPRPFMVERGHFDGVAPDETVAYEFAKIRNLYQAKLDIGDRAEIEWFAGPHSINLEGTLAFLKKHFGNPGRTPAQQHRQIYKSLTEQQRTAFREKLQAFAKDNSTLSREEKDTRVRKMLLEISKQK